MISKKKSLFWVIASLLLFAVFFLHRSASYGAQSKLSYSQVPHSADDFYNSLGVCAHVTVYSSSYGDKKEVLRQLQYLDIKYVRDDVRGPFDKMLETFKFFGQHGIRFDLIVHPTRVPHASDYVDEFIQLAPYLTAIEGANEIDNIHKRIPFEPDARLIYEKAISQQEELYRTVKSLPETRNLPVYNFTTVMHEHSDDLHELLQKRMEESGKPIADFDTVHAYDQTGLGPSKDTKKLIDTYSLLPALPKVLTETGYTTIKYSKENNKKGGWRGVSGDVSAKLLLNTIFDAYKWGIRKTYIYQLQDHEPDPGHTDKESHFGLFDYRSEPKPAAVALRNMRLILKDEGKTTRVSFQKENTPFSWSVEQTNAHKDYDFATHHLLLRKSDGTYFLIVWAEPEIWNPRTHAPITVPVHGNNVTISFDAPMEILAVYDPLESSAPESTYSAGRTVVLKVTDHPVILEIKP